MCDNTDDETDDTNQDQDFQSSIDDIPELMWDEAIIGSRRPYGDDIPDNPENGENVQE
jgi:hypothetical protein